MNKLEELEARIARLEDHMWPSKEEIVRRSNLVSDAMDAVRLELKRFPGGTAPEDDRPPHAEGPKGQ